MLIDAPVVNLSADGESAKSRWQAIIFHGHGGQARIEGGVFENDYVREKGVWKIATARYFPQFDGPYEEGWINWGGGDLPVVPKHFDRRDGRHSDSARDGHGSKDEGARSPRFRRVSMRSTMKTAFATCKPAYGFYADRKMWDDVVEPVRPGRCRRDRGSGSLARPRRHPSLARQHRPRGPHARPAQRSCTERRDSDHRAGRQRSVRARHRARHAR